MDMVFIFEHREMPIIAYTNNAKLSI
jgi:hypothetical protein